MKKELVYRNGHPVVVNEHGQRVFKTFMIVGSSFECDKNCPYCTAKITLWPRGENRFEAMEDRLRYLESQGIVFEYVTISGNGEPSMNRRADLKLLRDTIAKFSHLFEYKRFQTSGAIYSNDSVFDLFGQDYVFEITRTDLDSRGDMQTLEYKRDYTETENFKRSKVVFNHRLLGGNVDRMVEDIGMYIGRFKPVLHSLNLKILNLNTMNEDQLNNRFSRWILDNGIQKDGAEAVVAEMDRHFERTGDYNPFFDRFEWMTPEGIPITLYARKIKYGLPNVVFYRGKLIDYQLKPFQAEL